MHECGSTDEEYRQDHDDANLQCLLQQQAMDSNLKLDKHKLQIHLSEVVYIQHHLTTKRGSCKKEKRS